MDRFRTFRGTPLSTHSPLCFVPLIIQLNLCRKYYGGKIFIKIYIPIKHCQKTYEKLLLQDENMGKDAVIHCINNDTITTAQLTYNPGHLNLQAGIPVST